MELLEPRDYKGFCKHPIIDNTKRVVVKATITPSDCPKSWFELQIYFEDGEYFYTSSPSVRGAKQCFAFQCGAGSKWTD